MSKFFTMEERLADRFCPVYGREIGSEICYETVLVFDRILHRASVPELDYVHDMEAAKKRCESCPYVVIWGEEYSEI